MSFLVSLIDYDYPMSGYYTNKLCKLYRETHKLGGPVSVFVSPGKISLEGPAPHQHGPKQARRCSHSTWSLDDLWTAFEWV